MIDHEDDASTGGIAPPDGLPEIDPAYGVDTVKHIPDRQAMTAAATAASRAKRVTPAQKAIRVATVASMLVNGYKRRDVHAYIHERLFVQWEEPSERTIDRLIEAATKVVREEALVDLKLEKGKAQARLDDLYRKAVGAKLYGTALRVQRQINKMLGLDAPIAIKHGNDPENPMPAASGAAFVVLVQEVEEA